MKQRFTTNIDKDLIIAIKKKAIDENKNVNEIIEELFRELLNKEDKDENKEI